MSRGQTTLAQMVADLRLETGRSADTNLGQDEYASLCRVLKRMQETLYWDYEWPFLRVKEDILTEAGSRYYDFKLGAESLPINFERITSVKVKQGGIWTPVTRGITLEDYTIRDSDNDARQDPVQKWDVVNVEGGISEQVEFWPIPATNNLQVRFEGFRQLAPLVGNSDKNTLDDTLIVLHAAAKILTKDKSEDAKEAIAASTKHYNNLKRGSNRSGPTSMAGAHAPAQKGVIVIAPRSAGS